MNEQGKSYVSNELNERNTWIYIYIHAHTFVLVLFASAIIEWHQIPIPLMKPAVVNP